MVCVSALLGDTINFIIVIQRIVTLFTAFFIINIFKNYNKFIKIFVLLAVTIFVFSPSTITYEYLIQPEAFTAMLLVIQCWCFARFISGEFDIMNWKKNFLWTLFIINGMFLLSANPKFFFVPLLSIIVIFLIKPKNKYIQTKIWLSLIFFFISTAIWLLIVFAPPRDTVPWKNNNYLFKHLFTFHLQIIMPVIEKELTLPISNKEKETLQIIKKHYDFLVTQRICGLYSLLGYDPDILMYQSILNEKESLLSLLEEEKYWYENYQQKLIEYYIKGIKYNPLMYLQKIVNDYYLYSWNIPFNKRLSLFSLYKDRQNCPLYYKSDYQHDSKYKKIEMWITEINNVQEKDTISTNWGIIKAGYYGKYIINISKLFPFLWCIIFLGINRWKLTKKDKLALISSAYCFLIIIFLKLEIAMIHSLVIRRYQHPLIPLYFILSCYVMIFLGILWNCFKKHYLRKRRQS